MKEEKKTATTDDIIRISWAIGDKLQMPNEKTKKAAVCSIANALWDILSPGGEHWKRCPQRPKG
jgi:hypothetical protein